MEFSDEERRELVRIREVLARTTADLYHYLESKPKAPDDEIQNWPLWTAEQEFGGGVWCGDADCPLQAENSEIGDFRDPANFTMLDLHRAIGEHIDARREREGDETFDPGPQHD
jgi:hypothetical protein